jgi:hypothetical protein
MSIDADFSPLEKTLASYTEGNLSSEGFDPNVMKQGPFQEALFHALKESGDSGTNIVHDEAVNLMHNYNRSIAVINNSDDDTSNDKDFISYEDFVKGVAIVEGNIEADMRVDREGSAVGPGSGPPVGLGSSDVAHGTTKRS